MDSKSKATLELPSVLSKLAEFTSFSASRELALGLEPRPEYEPVARALRLTGEARYLLDLRSDVTLGGARDVRPQARRARRGGVLEPEELLDIQATLESARKLRRLLLDRDYDLPLLRQLAVGLEPLPELVEAIQSAVDERAAVKDQASQELARIRADLGTAQERLTARLQRLLNDARISGMLQEAIITQRDGRYVLPLKAEFKGKIKAVVHDQSSSGATLFIEPLEVVDANNRVRELELEERDEIHRILMELSQQVGAQEQSLTRTVELLADLDLTFAKARYGEKLGAVEPLVRPLEPREGGSSAETVYRLRRARHPLLDPDEVVPIDLDLDPGIRALVITGPNTGGKTVALKTAGLLTLMAQCGLHLPVESGSELSVFENVYADIGDEQSIEQSLSTFSAHVTNIIRILDGCGPTSLVVLDELGAGTDPQEGAALARSILDELIERGCTTLVATHYPELKMYAHQTEGVRNASVEFNLETLEPTYHLTIGLPGRSNALAIARRLGLQESILRRAFQGIAASEQEADDLLDEIRRERQQALAARERAQALEGQIQAQQEDLRRHLEGIDSERRAILARAREQAEMRIQELEEQAEELRSRIRRTKRSIEGFEEIEQTLGIMREQVSEIEPEPMEPEVKGLDRPLKVGDRVHVRSLNSEGELIELSEREAEVQMGRIRLRAEVDDLIPVARPGSRAKRAPAPEGGHIPSDRPRQAQLEFDLRGRSAEEALVELDRRLDAAFLAEQPVLRVIHGKGAGVLREVIRDALSNNPYVRSYRSGEPQEGGSGVTIVRLKSS